MIRLSIRRPVAVTMAYLGVALLGVAAWRNIPIELLPDTALPQLNVATEWRGASPEAMEAFVTAPLEGAIQQVRGVEKVTSVSSELFGWARANITVEFARGTDMDFARLDLSERMAVLYDELPPDAEQPRIEPYVPEEFREQQRAFLRYTLTGPHTLEALRAHVDDDIVPELLQVRGVAAVEVSGGRDRLIEIALDERKTQALGLDAGYVWLRINELEYVSEAGRVEDDGLLRTLAIRHRTASTDEIRRAPLLTDRGRIVRVGDVATLHDTYEEARSYYRIDAQPAVSFEVHKEVGVNTVEVADRVKARLDAIENLHPIGVRVILDEDESDAIRTQLTDLRYRALVAAGVIFLVLLLFLRSFRSAGIVFATIAFSILIALNLIYFGGLTLNVLTLMGLAMGFGLIVDNAIVVLENIYRRRRAGEPAGEASERGARQVVLPILAATLTTVIVFIPFVYLQGELRVYYVPLAIVVGMALVASLFVAFSFIPALAAKVLGSGGAGRTAAVRSGDASVPAYIRFYRGLLGYTLRLPAITVMIAAVSLGASYHYFDKYVTRGVLWRSWWGEQTYIDIIVRLPRGEELDRTDELARFFEAKLLQTPEVERFVTRVQSQFSRITVTFPDSIENSWQPVAIKEQMVAYSNLFGGAEVRVYGYGPSFYGGGAGPPNYSIKVLGYNYETVRVIAEDVGRRLQRFSRIQDVDVNSAGGWFTRDKATEYVLRLDRVRLGLHGLTARDVVYQVAAAVWGQVRPGNIRVAGEEVRFDVKLAGNEDVDVLELQELLVQTPAGQGVRLADVATLREREVLTRIVREDQQYQRYVSYEFRGPTRLGDRVRDAVIASTTLPEGYEIEGEQEWVWSTEEQQQIYVVLAISLVLIFMVTAALFESVRQPLTVLLTVPMALIGVFLMFIYTDASFTREAYIGVIMMGGIVVNNAILLVDHINYVRRVEGASVQDAIVRGTLERVRPILMTSATTIFGLLPLVLFSEYADENIWNALGYALIGGLASSTLLVLTVTPAIYLLLEERLPRLLGLAPLPGPAAAPAGI
ncbi:MAG: efflux RND transporter permease subunit [Gemmatimonadota bacterium]|nr:MAG: efflux RND transporter permease subunit [Gemmatimonadota bacterium]